MTTSYSLAPVPKWYIADLVGLPLAGGYMATFSSLNHSQFKAVYQDIGGVFPWPYVTIPNVGSLGILFDENGAQGPFYFKFDSTVPDDLYYIEIYDADGVLQWTIDDFTGVGSGGGGTVTTALDLQNQIPNNVMYRNTGTTAFTPTTFQVLAPGANAGLALTASLAGPDICFIKNNTSATDLISFPKFTLGSGPLTGDVTPVDYLRMACTSPGSGETSKYVQFPITQGCQNLTNQDVTVTIWARCVSGNTNITLYFLQFYGDGAGASTSTRSSIQTLTLTSSWQKFSMQATVPDATGKVLGGCGNDGLFLQVEYALDASTTVDLTKPCLFLGSISPDQEYQVYDAIDAVVDTARTGDTRTSLNSFYPFGWVPMNDGSVGDASSNATARANVDTFPLFNLIWNLAQPYDSGSTFNPIAQLYDSAGTVQNYGATSVVDFVAHKQLQVPASFGHAVAGTVPVAALLPTVYTQTVSGTNSGGNLLITLSSGPNTINNGVPVAFTGSLPSGIVANAVYWVTNFNSSLFTFNVATSFANYLSATVVAYTSDATMTINTMITGAFSGEYSHTQISSEVALSNLSTNGNDVYSQLSAGGTSHSLLNLTAPSALVIHPYTTGNASPRPLNVIQPTTFMNMFIKL